MLCHPNYKPVCGVSYFFFGPLVALLDLII